MPPIPEPPLTPAQRRQLILKWLAAHDRPAPGLRFLPSRVQIPTKPRGPVSRPTRSIAPVQRIPLHRYEHGAYPYIMGGDTRRRKYS